MPNTLTNGQTLSPGQALLSPNGRFELAFDTGGHAVYVSGSQQILLEQGSAVYATVNAPANSGNSVNITDSGQFYIGLAVVHGCA